MKSILEASVYLIIFAFISYFSIDLIMLNCRVTDVNRVARYVENYIEAKGEAVYDSDGQCRLSKEVEETLVKYCADNDCTISFDKTDETEMYCYVDYSISYELKSALAGYNKVHQYSGLARFNY
ncbi:MAG: hypothetical protein ACI4E1_06345 [Lachnospira sp.]